MFKDPRTLNEETLSRKHCCPECFPVSGHTQHFVSEKQKKNVSELFQHFVSTINVSCARKRGTVVAETCCAMFLQQFSFVCGGLNCADIIWGLVMIQNSPFSKQSSDIFKQDSAILHLAKTWSFFSSANRRKYKKMSFMIFTRTCPRYSFVNLNGNF